jgi:hypothetical protein
LLFLWLWDFLLKESSLALSIVCYNILSCLYFCLPIIQSTCPLFRKGLQRYTSFPFLQIFLKIFFVCCINMKKECTFAPVMVSNTHNSFRFRVRR